MQECVDEIGNSPRRTFFWGRPTPISKQTVDDGRQSGDRPLPCLASFNLESREQEGHPGLYQLSVVQVSWPWPENRYLQEWGRVVDA